VWQHASNSSPEYLGRSPVVHNSPAGIGQESLTHKLSEFNLVTEEGTGNVETLSSYHRHPLT
jgi:hypothetical protein